MGAYPSVISARKCFFFTKRYEWFPTPRYNLSTDVPPDQECIESPFKNFACARVCVFVEFAHNHVRTPTLSIEDFKASRRYPSYGTSVVVTTFTTSYHGVCVSNGVCGFFLFQNTLHIHTLYHRTILLSRIFVKDNCTTGIKISDSSLFMAN